MSGNTVRLHRGLRAAPERVYRAFLTADAMVKWLPPHGFTAMVHPMDAKAGGTFRMSFTNFSSGQTHSFGGEYLELVPNELIRCTDRFDDPNLPGVMQGAAGHDFKVFFLLCVIVAGVFGAFTASRKILYLQALPGLIGLVLVLDSR